MTTSMAQISPVTLSLESAHRLAVAATKKAEEIGIPYTVTIVDGGGNVVHVSRMDGAALASIDTSLSKARTSVYFGAATADLASAVQPGAPLYTIPTSTVLPLAFVAGAVPVADSAGVVIGAVGAGGGSPQQDHEVAISAASAL
ncbi:GlcG/HbpS family heme-binding protein [Pseudonocardia alaniniphila]|uniref:Heme-binding protein n=1 Tax=Pseudonocardia alaniniphila TaxID=75291 RepID=A0ABS9TS36_9PSEU|nr:heme-binding protein [Pseudonocardia alaniniphila]MCH6171173.1 heme-binding protein [Pseudonocardia alaniniphila]